MNIAIIGSGLTGSLAAISLAKAGCRVDLYERLSDEELVNRDRTYAITHSSRKILEKIGIWRHIASNLVPFQYLNVCLLYTSPSPRDGLLSRMPSSA